MPAVYSGMQVFFSGLVPMDSCLNELRVLQLAEFLHHVSVLIALHSPAQTTAYPESTITDSTYISKAMTCVGSHFLTMYQWNQLINFNVSCTF